MTSSNSFKAFALYALTLAGHLMLVSGNFLEPRDTAGCGKPHKVDGVSRDFEVSTNGGNRTYRIHLPSSSSGYLLPWSWARYGGARDTISILQ